MFVFVVFHFFSFLLPPHFHLYLKPTLFFLDVDPKGNPKGHSLKLMREFDGNCPEEQMLTLERKPPTNRYV